MDTFNVEGLWACFLTKEPKSNHFIKIRRSDNI